ncbi:hypothetical protein SAMN04515668_4380 [Hymenobacter arizonensis]|uniref:Uncharacterized protein n=1 Tax=Hymenobacter arizonensis TaxID=1227077 RepID=A0A1I6BDA9_HYMAR|nr:hypothetical protein SAMN04515668_4380 [Hymenobacter arizonensis]
MIPALPVIPCQAAAARAPIAHHLHANSVIAQGILILIARKPSISTPRNSIIGKHKQAQTDPSGLVYLRCFHRRTPRPCHSADSAAAKAMAYYHSEAIKILPFAAHRQGHEKGGRRRRISTSTGQPGWHYQACPRRSRPAARRPTPGVRGRTHVGRADPDAWSASVRAVSIRRWPGKPGFIE